MGANAGIGVLKLVAGIFTGSARHVREAAHSVADTATEVLLLTALKRSDRKRRPAPPVRVRQGALLLGADRRGQHLRLRGRLRRLRGHPDDARRASRSRRLAWVAYAVLAVSFLLEGTSWVQAVRQLRNEARGTRRRRCAGCAQTDDPTVKTVFFEDSAALIGLLLAFAGVGLHQLTGSAFWDGLASVLIARAADGRRLHPRRDEQGAAHRPPGRRPDRVRAARRRWPTGRRWSRSSTCLR